MIFRYKSSSSKSHLKDILDRFYSEFNFQERLKHDPIEFPHRYSNPEDIEIVSFIASCFAYGKVGLFKPVIKEILKPAGKHPANFFLNFNPEKDTKYIKGISYRFNKEKDIFCLVYILSKALKKYGSIKDLFYHYYRPEHEDISIALTGFVDYFLSIDISPVYMQVNSSLSSTTKKWNTSTSKPSGLIQFFPSPRGGSACKRMNLFLRWMVRNKDIDFGIWDNISPSKLIIPLDTHIARISRCLGLTKKTASDWKTAKEITESLKKLDPCDPLRYDFALCHYGISGLCKGKRSDSCLDCVIYQALTLK